MPRSRQSSTSSDIETIGEYSVVKSQENDKNHDDQDEDPVVILLQGYLNMLTKIDHFPNQTDETRSIAKEQAYHTLITQISELKNPTGALEKIEYLLQGRIPMQNKDISEKTSVELIEKSRSMPPTAESSKQLQQVATTSTLAKFEVLSENLVQIKRQSDPNAAEIELEKLFDIDENGETHFNKDLLLSLCKQAGSRPIATISTTGKFRGAKTFWNNILLNGLQNGVAHFQPTDYIGGQGGIRFMNGWARHTTGIMVWPKVFIRKDKTGEEIAVILMDTQGTYDCETDPAHSAIIFAIALLMSSVKIFNTKNQIDAQDLDSLNLFIEYCRMNSAVMGQRFILMTRDSVHSGFDRGAEYLQYIKTAAKKAHGLNRLVEGLFNSFEKFDCFMAPRPTDHVIQASGEIQARDCGKEFLDSLCECANNILTNLEPKMVMGVQLTGDTLEEFVKNLVEHLQNADLKGIGTAFNATKELYFEKARNTAIEIFTALFEELVKKHRHCSVKPQEYEKELNEISKQAIEVYNKQTLFGNDEEKARVFNDFEKYLKDRCAEKAYSNRFRYRDVKVGEAVQESYDIYEKMMKPNFKDSLQGNTSVEIVRTKHESARNKAMDNFETVIEDFNDEESFINEKRTLLEQMIKTRYANLEEDSFILQINSGLKKIIEKLIEAHETYLKNCVEKVIKIEKAEAFIEEAKNMLQANYNVEKTNFGCLIKMQMPKLDEEMIYNIIDNYKETRADLFKKCEDNFMSNVRQHLQFEKLRQQLENQRHKQTQRDRAFEEKLDQERKRVKELKDSLEKEARERALEQKTNDLQNNPMFIVMKQMREETERLRHAAEERQASRDAARLEVEIEKIRNDFLIRKMELELRDREIQRKENQERIDREVAEKLKNCKERKAPTPPPSPPPPPPPPPPSSSGFFSFFRRS